jgi:hypothetical protein
VYLASLPPTVNPHPPMNGHQAKFPRLQSLWARLCAFAVVSLVLFWVFLPHHESHFPPWTASLAQELGHPMFPDIRSYERNLPQHVMPSLLSKGTDRPRYEDSNRGSQSLIIRRRYLFFPNATWGCGSVFDICLERFALADAPHFPYRWNNILQEQ